MSLQDYTSAGNSNTFTAWIEQRLDKVGSIWGGSSFKFGIYSRRSKAVRETGAAMSYSADYAWYTKYGSTPEQAFGKVRSLVAQVAEAAAQGRYSEIDEIDLGESYKWKIAFHYQNRATPGVVAVFKRKRLKAWLKGRVASLPQDTETSALYREVLAQNRGQMDLLDLSTAVWTQTDTGPTEPPGNEGGEEAGNVAEGPLEAFPDQPLNLILYGPPGTGKTYRTAELAVGICDGSISASRKDLMDRYRELKALQRIRFVTFHPSFTYEEFVEGIRPSTENGQVRYDVRPGIFKQVVTHAREMFERPVSSTPPANLQKRRLFKMSLGDTSKADEAWVFPDCIDNSRVCLGFGGAIDFTGSDSLQAIRDKYMVAHPDIGESDFATAAVDRLKNELRTGDLVLISEGNTRFRAIAEVTGPYSFIDREEGYQQARPVKWLWTTTGETVPVSTILGKRLSQQSIYRIDQDAVKWDALRELLAPKGPEGKAPNCVLVIDEINRANLAKTFGELITLLEASKRLGRPDQQETDLPYSGDRFAIPPNLYVIGTMNTADRSIALLDIALRRRFDFREMAPEPAQLPTDLAGVDLRKLLSALNDRIETLIDRDHTLGHTYLMHLEDFEDLESRFRNQVIPLLQEYFFDDWGRIQQVFRDDGRTSDLQIIQSVPLREGEKGLAERPRYRVNAIISPAAIQKIYEDV